MSAPRAATSSALLVSEVFPPQIGGSGEFLMNVYRRFQDVPVVVLTDGAPGDARTESGLRVVQAPMRTPQWGLAHPAGAYSHLKGIARISAMARRLKPCVVHCGRALPEGLDAWAGARLTGAKYVCWVHGEEIACQSESRELGILLTRAIHGADALVANSRSTAGAIADLGVDPSRVTVVYPGVDATRFHPGAAGAAALRASLAQPHEVLFLTVGRLQRRKGHDLVLQALATLPSDLPYRYVIVGDGAERARLAALTHELGLDARVHFAGAATAEALPAYYAAADVFLHPNRVDGRDVEGFGIVFLEAAASGLPVIAGSSGGAPEAVVDGTTGALVSGTDAAELAGVLVRMARDRDLRVRLGSAGRQRVLTDFSWDRSAAAVVAIHRRLAAGRA